MTSKLSLVKDEGCFEHGMALVVWQIATLE